MLFFFVIVIKKVLHYKRIKCHRTCMKKIISVFCIFFFTLTHAFASGECQQMDCSDNNYYQDYPPGYPDNNYQDYPGDYPDNNSYQNGDECTLQGCLRYTPMPGCYPSAPICGTYCGVSICAIVFAIALVAGVAVLVASTGHSSTIHAANQ